MVPLRLASRPSNDQQPCAAYWIAPPPTDAKNRILKSVLEGLRLTGLRLLNKSGSTEEVSRTRPRNIARSANRHTGRLSPSEVGASRVISFSSEPSCLSCVPWRARWRSPVCGFSPCRPFHLCRFLPCLITVHFAAHFLAEAPRVFSFPFPSHSILLTKVTRKGHPAAPAVLSAAVREPDRRRYHCRHFGSGSPARGNATKRVSRSGSPRRDVFQKSRWQQPCLPSLASNYHY
jgi:hypothetical protein